MIKATTVLLACAGLVPAGLALADPAGLVLTQGKVRTDPAGAFVDVAVKNAGAAAVDRVAVRCEFFAQKTALGTSATTLFALVPGVTGTDQVRLMGATSATDATCALTTPKD